MKRPGKRIEWTDALETRLIMFWDECGGEVRLVAMKLNLPLSKVKDHAKSMGLRKHSSKTPKKCLCCDKKFFSSGAHNRICSDCTKSELFRGNVA